MGPIYFPEFFPDEVILEFARLSEKIVSNLEYWLIVKRFAWRKEVDFWHLPKKKSLKNMDSYGISFWYDIQFSQEKEKFVRRKIHLSIDMSSADNKNYFLSFDVTLGNEKLSVLYEGAEIAVLPYAYDHNPYIFADIQDYVVRPKEFCWFIEIENEEEKKNKVISFFHKLFEWLFNREEIIEVLRGEKWIDKYSPPPWK